MSGKVFYIGEIFTCTLRMCIVHAYMHLEVGPTFTAKRFLLSQLANPMSPRCPRWDPSLCHSFHMCGFYFPICKLLLPIRVGSPSSQLGFLFLFVCAFLASNPLRRDYKNTNCSIKNSMPFPFEFIELMSTLFDMRNQMVKISNLL